MSALEHAVLTSATATTGSAAVALSALAVTGRPEGLDPGAVLVGVSAVSFLVLLVATVLMASASLIRRRPQLPAAVWAWVAVLAALPLGAVAVS